MHRIEIAVPFLGSVNVWLLEGDPLTLVDTGPANAASLEALEAALARARVLDRRRSSSCCSPTTTSITPGSPGRSRRGSGARIAATAGTAAWGASYHERAALEAAFGRRLLAAHGVPPNVIESSEPFWEHIIRNSASFATTDVLADGDVVHARAAATIESSSARDTASPTRSSSTTSDGVAIVGDHLLPEITSGAEVVPVEPSGSDPAAGARRSTSTGSAARRRWSSTCCSPATGPRSTTTGSLIARANRVPRAAARARRRLDRRRAAARRSRSRSASGTRRPRETQAVLVVWEVVGHLDVLAERGLVVEVVGDCRQPHVPTERARERTHRQRDSDPQRKERRVIDRRHAKPPRAVRPHGLHRDRHRRDEGPRSRDRDRARRRGSGHRDREPQARGLRGDG